MDNAEFQMWEDLCDAVIIRAAADYRKLKRRLSGPLPEYQKMLAEQEIKEIERFLASEWGEELSRKQGKLILKKLKERDYTKQ